jgi:hypothetical protein
MVQPRDRPLRTDTPVSFAMNERPVVGLNPWLPWPLRGWTWWTAPVRAERLAALRIGLAVVLLIDILSSYWPHSIHYFASTYFGHEEVLGSKGWMASSSQHWTLLHGVHWAVESALIAILCGLATLVIFIVLVGRLTIPPAPEDRSGILLQWALPVWIVTAGLALLGIWARAFTIKGTDLNWFGPLLFYPLLVWLLATVFVLLELGIRLRGYSRPSDAGVTWLLGGAWGLATGLLFLGLVLMNQAENNQELPALVKGLATPWNDSHTFLYAAMTLWILSTLSLLAGCWTRTCAVLTWLLSQSFANLNPNIDNAGDAVRGITLFYLMLSPCGAVWSVDRLRQRRPGPVFNYPWPLRLLFIQMVMIYFFNGLYKLLGQDWREGESLYYVLCDLVLSRFSYEQLPLTFFWTKILTWTVLVWELGFPLFVAIPYVRTAALCCGVAFHLGIWLSLEIGGFVPYMLVLYLPLLPWESAFGLPSAKLQAALK